LKRLAYVAVLSAWVAAPHDFAAEDVANPQAGVPPPLYQPATPSAPHGVEQQDADWKKSNAEVGQFPRGHADILKWEKAQGPAGTSAPAAAHGLVLDADSAVRIAVTNNPGLDAAMAALAIGDAERRQASQLPNPLLTLSRVREGQALSIERMLSFNVLQLITLPWRAKIAGQRQALARLEAAQQVIRTAADTRKAWFEAVAAAQTARYLADARDAAEAGAELARRMARVGNFSRLQQAREEATLAEISAQLARARQEAVSKRERLTRLMGLWGQDAQYALPEQLPALPQQLPAREDVEAQALRERVDVRAARDEALYVADSLGYVRASGVLDALTLGVKRNTDFDNAAGTRASGRGAEIELPLPLFDWGQANAARADAVYSQAVARVRQVAVQARSEARESWHAWRTAYDVARHYRDEVVPLRKFINDETVLRYNGMLASAWELLAETRNHVGAITGAINAQRDFWIADTDLNTALTGTSPGALAALQGNTKWTDEASSAAH
jgi:outer membrane protein TolC